MSGVKKQTSWIDPNNFLIHLSHVYLAAHLLVRFIKKRRENRLTDPLATILPRKGAKTCPEREL
jgi:hypothetical protein